MAANSDGRQANREGFQEVFDGLWSILRPYAKRMAVKEGPMGGLCLACGFDDGRKQPTYFAGAAVRKAYVSYHLMPVYCFPDLLRGISPALRRRMQGKSCFNFRRVDATLFRELQALTQAGYRRFRKEGLAR